MISSSLSGPRLSPPGPATHLVVLVHGYGADGRDLIALAGQWRGVLPSAAFVAPNAPQRAPGTSGYQWFALARLDPVELRQGVAEAAPVLDAFCDAELQRLSLPPERLILAGFSQGTMLSLHVGLRRAAPPAAVVGFSGMLTEPPPVRPDGPPVFLAHGDIDQVVPAAALPAAIDLLTAAGRRVQWHLARGVGHGIDPETLILAGRFLGQVSRGEMPPTGPV